MTAVMTNANRETMQQMVEDLRARLDAVKQGGGEAEVRRHKERGKMFVGERDASRLIACELGRDLPSRVSHARAN